MSRRAGFGNHGPMDDVNHLLPPTAAVALPVARDVIRASGPDTVTFLQGQLSQDVAVLQIGASAWSFLLAPQGKVEAWLRVTRTEESVIVLDVDAGFGDAVVARLQRFKLRTRCDLEPLEGWAAIALRGAATEQLDRAAVLKASGGVVAADCHWPVVAGFDVLGPELSTEGLTEFGLHVADHETYERLRICCGVPAMGRELDQRTIPAEAGALMIDRSVSFTKGCYTGQELVARVDSRGNNVPQRLVGLVASSDRPFMPGMVLRLPGQSEGDVGRITSVASTGERGQSVALAFLRRAADVPIDVVAIDPSGADGGHVVAARALALPLYR